MNACTTSSYIYAASLFHPLFLSKSDYVEGLWYLPTFCTVNMHPFFQPNTMHCMNAIFCLQIASICWSIILSKLCLLELWDINSRKGNSASMTRHSHIYRHRAMYRWPISICTSIIGYMIALQSFSAKLLSNFCFSSLLFSDIQCGCFLFVLGKKKYRIQFNQTMIKITNCNNLNDEIISILLHTATISQ